MFGFNFVVIIVLLTQLYEVYTKIPDYIQVCQRNNPDLVKCITESVTNLKPHLKTGMPEVDVPPLEPLLLDSIEIKSGIGSANIAATISNLKIWGPTTFIIREIKPNLDKNIFKFRVAIPKLHIEGDYSMNTKVLFVTLKGQGPVNINITDYGFECRLKGNKVQRDGLDYLEFEKMKIKIEVGKSSIRLENLFNGDPVLGRATNEVLNDNAEVFVNEIKPYLQNALSEKFTSIANKITLKFPYKDLFP